MALFFLQTPEQILEKIRSYSHGEFNNSDLDKKEIEERILNNEDIFKRGKTLKKVALDETFPSFILNNKENFLKWII